MRLQSGVVLRYREESGGELGVLIRPCQGDDRADQEWTVVVLSNRASGGSISVDSSRHLSAPQQV